MQRNPGPADHGSEQGFTLVEVLMSLAIITVVMTSVAVFLMDSVRTSRQQSVRDTAAQVAMQGMESARGIRGAALLGGRAACNASNCNPVVSDTVRDLLGGTPQRWDAAGAGPPVLPAPGPQVDGSVVSGPGDPEVVVLNGLTFKRYYYVSKCWQVAATDGLAATDRTCTTTPASQLTAASFLRLVVAITWPGQECQGTCTFATTSLISASPSDPYLATSLPLAPLTNPGDQVGRTGVAVPALSVAGAVGEAPLTWSAANLPNGLAINPSTGAVTGTPSTVATYAVEIRVTDALGKTAETKFNWAVLPPVLTTPADQLSRTSTAVSLPMVVTGGVGPLAWSATGLPSGLTINASTGVISGTTSTTTQPLTPATVTVVDRSTPAQTVSTTFRWRVVTLPVVANPGPQTLANGAATNNFYMTASGGTGSYVWRGYNLPDGLTINSSSGLISGTVRSGSRYITTVTATDSAGGVGSATVVVTVSPNPPATDLRITSPAADRSTTLGAAVNLSAVAAGGTTPYTWTATGLPPGLTLSSGVISGSPTARGTYTVTLTVQSPNATKATMMIVWTVT